VIALKIVRKYTDQVGLPTWEVTALVGLPADFGKLIAEETEKWAKVVKYSGAKPD